MPILCYEIIIYKIILISARYVPLVAFFWLFKTQLWRFGSSQNAAVLIYVTPFGFCSSSSSTRIHSKIAPGLIAIMAADMLPDMGYSFGSIYLASLFHWHRFSSCDFQVDSSQRRALEINLIISKPSIVTQYCSNHW